MPEHLLATVSMLDTAHAETGATGGAAGAAAAAASTGAPVEDCRSQQEWWLASDNTTNSTNGLVCTYTLRHGASRTFGRLAAALSH